MRQNTQKTTLPMSASGVSDMTMVISLYAPWFGSFAVPPTPHVAHAKAAVENNNANAKSARFIRSTPAGR
jgi:hypothetical protein